MPTGGSVSAGVLAMVLVGAFGGAVAGLWNLLIASLIGALAGHELAVDIRSPPVLTLIGAASGVIAAVLIAVHSSPSSGRGTNPAMADLMGIGARTAAAFLRSGAA